MSDSKISIEVTRRRLLAGAAAITGAAALNARNAAAEDVEKSEQSCPVSPASGRLEGNPEVIIIGAGAAGIAASKQLASQGVSRVVIEAAARIGGRALTLKTLGVPLDIGCAWIHAADCNPFFAVARKKDNGFHLVCHNLSLNSVYYKDGPSGEAGAQAVRGAEERIHEAVDAEEKQLRAAGGDAPVSDVMTSRDPVREAAATYMGPMDMAVDFADLSLRDYAQSANLDPNYLVVEGFGSVIRKAADGVAVKTCVTAEAIHYGGEGVTVETSAGAITAKAVIVTVSLGVLAADRIKFNPPLPVTTREAIHGIGMGLLTKLPFAIAKSALDLPANSNILRENGVSDSMYFLARPFDSDLVVGFIGGALAWDMSRLDPMETVELGKRTLVEMFGSAIRDKIRYAPPTGWARNALTLGAYSAALPGHFKARAALADSIADRVFFAGEALAGPLIQTAGGAALSGRNVAMDVGDVLSGVVPPLRKVELGRRKLECAPA